MYLHGKFENNLEDTKELILNVNKQVYSQSAGASNTQPNYTMNDLSTNNSIAQEFITKINNMISSLEHIQSRLRHKYNIGEEKKSKELEYYENLINKIKNITDYESSEFKNACSQLKRISPFNKSLEGHSELSKKISDTQDSCKKIMEKLEKEKKMKKEEGKKFKELEAKLEKAQKKAEKTSREGPQQTPRQAPQQAPQQAPREAPRAAPGDVAQGAIEGGAGAARGPEARVAAARAAHFSSIPYC